MCFITVNKMAAGMVGLCINLPNLCALLFRISQVITFLKRVSAIFEVNVVCKPKWPILWFPLESISIIGTLTWCDLAQFECLMMKWASTRNTWTEAFSKQLSLFCDLRLTGEAFYFGSVFSWHPVVLVGYCVKSQRANHFGP